MNERLTHTEVAEFDNEGPEGMQVVDIQRLYEDYPEMLVYGKPTFWLMDLINVLKDLRSK